MTVPLAVAAALLRVLAGVHYPHDVLAGSLLGGVVVAALLLLAQHPMERAASAALRRVRGHDTRLMGHDGGCGPVLHPEAGQDGAHMRLDGSLHHVEPPGDLPVGQSAAEERSTSRSLGVSPATFSRAAALRPARAPVPPEARCATTRAATFGDR